MQESSNCLKGEYSGRLAVRAGVAWLTDATVAMYTFAQEGHAGCPVLALMALATHQGLATVMATIKDSIMAFRQADALVAAQEVLTCGSIMTRVGGTSSSILLTQGT